MAATSLHTAALPALSYGSRKSQVVAGQAEGLRCVGDRTALRSSFYNAGASLVLPRPGRPSLPRISMRVAAKDAYICRDCGYIYTDRKPFEKLPDDFLCPVCGAPKRRFKPYDAPVSRNSNDQAVRKARKAGLKKNDAAGGTLPIGIAVGLAALLGVFFYLNGQY